MRQEASEDPKYLSNVNSAILNSIEKATLVRKKRNEQRMYSPVQILNAKNAILGLPKNTTFGHT